MQSTRLTRPIIDSSNACNQDLHLSCARRCMDRSNSQFIGVLGCTCRSRFLQKLSLFLRGSSPPRNTVARAKPTHHPKRHLDRLRRFCIGPKCYAVQRIVNGEENPPKTVRFPLEFRHPAGATAIGNQYLAISQQEVQIPQRDRATRYVSKSMLYFTRYDC